MTVLKRIWGHLKVVSRARRNQGDLPRWLARRPQLAAAIGGYESALLAMGRTDSRLKALATIKTAMLVNCEFCLDIGSELARMEGLDEPALRALPNYRDSDEFTEVEKLVLRLAEEMTRTPALVSDDLRAALLQRLTRAQLLEIVAEISWENQRARLNQGLGIRPAGFSDGSYCAMPEPAPPS